MLVKTPTGKYGRITRAEPGSLKIKVQILDENLYPLKNVYEYHKANELIYRPEIIVKL